MAIATPNANLVDGMRWLQGTFATRFNRMRDERGHLFQGRYQSLVVDPDGGLGPLCHYIHLNPVRAKLLAVAGLPAYRWASVSWLLEPKRRPEWFHPEPALEHAGGLADTAAGRRKYLEYLGWLAEDGPAQKAQRFAEMSKGWIIGTRGFAKDLMKENRRLTGHGRQLAAEMKEAREGVWQEELSRLLGRLRRKPTDVAQAPKSATWKVAIAAAMKARTTVTNRWLAEALNMGGLHEVSRQVSAWLSEPDTDLQKRLG